MIDNYLRLARVLFKYSIRKGAIAGESPREGKKRAVAPFVTGGTVNIAGSSQAWLVTDRLKYRCNK